MTPAPAPRPLPPAPRRRSTRRGRAATLVVALLAAVGVVQHRAELGFLPRVAPPVAALFPEFASTEPVGRSGELRVHIALPGDTVPYPLALRADTAALHYEWVRAGSGEPASAMRVLAGAALVAPTSPGFFHLALVQGPARQLLDDVTVAVLVPFEAKEDGRINGYRIGTYLAERFAGRYDRPAGFLEVRPEDLALPLTRHFRVGDFVTRDGQQSWPRYVALEPKLLDKLELVLAEVRAAGTDSLGRELSVRVNAGFRTPEYNRTVPGSARNSQHQYGDAADVAIDANADGRVDRTDTKLVALAVREVERENPDLAGGLGLYTSRKWARPFVHIDARGRPARWTR